MDCPPKRWLLITSDHVIMRSLIIKWPESPRAVCPSGARAHPDRPLHPGAAGESWRTAAIPMENPYCSCKLTRARSRCSTSWSRSSPTTASRTGCAPPAWTSSPPTPGRSSSPSSAGPGGQWCVVGRGYHMLLRPVECFLKFDEPSTTGAPSGGAGSGPGHAGRPRLRG